MSKRSPKNIIEQSFTAQDKGSQSALELESGSRVAVLGAGPAGSFFSYFLLDMANRIGLDLQVDMFERKDFNVIGPAGCNMCGGIISESLVQSLATEGINLPPTVVELGIDSYVLHMDVGSVRIATPLNEKRIASIHRGAGPKGTRELKWQSFDNHLQNLAVAKGTNLIRGRIENVSLVDGRPNLKMKDGFDETYDLLAVATGVNTGILKLFEALPIKYVAPKTSGTYICEFYLGREKVEEFLGSSMHVFLLNIPRLEFAAVIPKGEFMSICLLGHEIDDKLVKSFMESPEVMNVLPPDWELPKTYCHCSPRISLRSSPKPYADRIVFIGDCGATRLYKDGIGASYRTAKAAASTAVLEGISEESFRKHFYPACTDIERDNMLGRLIFMVTREIQRRRIERRGVLRMVSKEQNEILPHRRMSMVLWDTFTGSAAYSDILKRTFNPRFITRLIWEIIVGLFSKKPVSKNNADKPKHI